MNFILFFNNFTSQTMYYSMSHHRHCVENMAELRQRWRARVGVSVEIMSHQRAVPLTLVHIAMHCVVPTFTRDGPGCQPTR